MEEQISKEEKKELRKLEREKTKENNLSMLVVENFYYGMGKDLQELMMEAGYKKDELETFGPIMKDVNENIKSKQFIGELDKKKRLALSCITEVKMQLASAKDLANIVDVLNRTEQLLKGNATHRLDINKNISDDTRYRTILQEALEGSVIGGEEEVDELLLGSGQEVSGELAPPADSGKVGGSGGESKEWPTS